MVFFCGLGQETTEASSRPCTPIPSPPPSPPDEPPVARLGDVEAMDFAITILQGQDLTPKDRSCFGLGKSNSSDPYVKVLLVVPEASIPTALPTRPIRNNNNKKRKKWFSKRPPSLQQQPAPNAQDSKIKLGRTRTIYKTLHPQWNETLYGSLRGGAALKAHASDRPAVLELNIMDEDQLSRSDPMGTIRIALPTVAMGNVDQTDWHPVPPDSAPNARGRLQIRIQTWWRPCHILVRGNRFQLTPSFPPPKPNNPTIRLGIAWDAVKSSSSTTIELEAACVAVSHEGQVIMPDTVYYGNLANSNSSALHSGDDPTKIAAGDDQSITLELDKIPLHILAMYVILTVTTPDKTWKHVESTRVRVVEMTPSAVASERTLCTFEPPHHPPDATAMVLLRIARDPSGAPKPGNVSKKWILTPIQDAHPTARDFGALIPHVKAYTRDLVSHRHRLVVDPTERVAILRKGDAIRLADYSRHNRLPQKVTFGLAWDPTDGDAVDLDASAICFDAKWNLIDMVWWKQLHSKDYNIVHHGDQRRGDKAGDDELIDLHLHNMMAMGEHCHVRYIGFVINSYSGQKLKDVHRASCHLFDPKSNAEMAAYALTNAKALEGVTALLVGCLFRAPQQHPHHHGDKMAHVGDEWCFTILSKASEGCTVKANVEEFRDYLRTNPLTPVVESGLEPVHRVIDANMPPFAPLADETQLVLIPSVSPTHSTSTVSSLSPPLIRRNREGEGPSSHSSSR